MTREEDSDGRDEQNGDRHALYLLDTRNPAQWELLRSYPTRAEAEAEAAVVAQHERIRATRILVFATGLPVPRFLDNTTGDRDARVIARGFALFDPEGLEAPDDASPGAAAALPREEEYR